MDASLKIPREIAVMILPETVLFPGGLLPLFIFEPRYRAMLDDALATHRMFAIGLMLSQEEEIFPVGCVGFVRACVANPDGTSHLMLQGVGRVEFTGMLEGKPYPQASIKVLSSQSPSHDKAEIFRREIKALAQHLPEQQAEVRRQIEGFLERTSGLEEFSDLVSSTIISDFSIRQRLLEELVVENRIAILAAYITQMMRQTE